MIRSAFLIAVLLVVVYSQAMAQSTDREYYEPYVIPVSFAGTYLKVEYGGLTLSGAPAAENYSFGMLSHILQGTYKPRFKSIIAGEAGWSFPKTRLSTLEQRTFGVTGDISLKFLNAAFDLAGPVDKHITATYTQGIGSISFGAGINFNYRFQRKHFLKVGFKVYPTLLECPDLFVEIKPDAPNGAESRSVITASGESPVENGMINEYVSGGAPAFALQYAFGADVILLKKFVAGIGYHHGLITADYTYYNDTRGGGGAAVITEKNFKANLNYSHVSLRAGFYFSRGYK